MGRDINPVIFKNLKAFLEVFFKEVNFWPLILDISWVSGGMIALFWRKMLFFGPFVLFSVGKHGFVYPLRSPDMNTRLWFVPSSVPFSLLIRTPITPCRNLEVHREIKKNINALTLWKLCATIYPLRPIFLPNNNNGQVVYPITNVPLVDQCVNVFIVLMFMKMKHVRENW